MRNVRVFKWVVVLLLVVACYGAYKALNSPIDQTVYKVEKVNSQVSLYVTEGSAGATTAFVYQFYLVPPKVTEATFLKGIGDKYQPFLSTSDGNAKIAIRDSAIHLNVKGDVYRFTNGASYSITIYLNASPF
ncbi:hypothetical protein MT962_000665 [Franconibacter sp. IITDAS19]|uniref:hypothetical protein n=1 Tax=Franconibacter sp. IITDAS19 TaxID=2930569 RepID=UPI001FFA5212|nr:hypothetical protein [Franconibacter sp. IITDAS19]MCK1966878.1 hypothetical protein [Franconibacter sp. IITDAS19]